MRILLSGGCKNGKSDYAQRIAKGMCSAGRPLYYVATMRPVDGEDAARIARHRADRAGWGFATVEQPTDIHRLGERCDLSGCLLVDSATALLMNEMFPLGGDLNPAAGDKLCGDFARLLAEASHIVVVSDGIYSDAICYDPLTEGYRRALARVERQLAALCDGVAEVAAGTLLCYKGGQAIHHTLKEARR